MRTAKSSEVRGADKWSRAARTIDPILTAYSLEVDRIPTLNQKEEKDLLARIEKGDRKAVNDLVSGNLKFVIAVCWKYRNRGLPIPDLINEANLGLFRAVEHFEIASEVRFMSYAVWWVRSGIMNAIARQPGSISFPPAGMALATRMRRTENALAQRLGRLPRKAELSEALGTSRKSLASVENLVECISCTRSSGCALLGDSGISAPSREAGPESGAETHLNRKSLDRHFQRLNDRERRVLSLRYGFEGVCFSLSEVSDIIGVTRERIRQIEMNALKKLRRVTRVLRN